MLVLSNLRFTVPNPILLHLITLYRNPDSPLPCRKRFSSLSFRGPKRFSVYCFTKSPMPPRPPPPPPHVAAEYAKSARSTCKMCTKAILKKALRVGIVSRDGRGFDMTKWHHLDCFPVGAVTVASAEEIKGFEALQSGDQEALKKLLDGGDKSAGDAVVHKRDNDEENEPEERDVKKAKVHKRDSDEENEPEERDVKKGKLSPSYREASLDIAFSVSSVKNMYKDATLQPKWKAFKTVIFLEQDDGLHDSHKIAAFDFDGTLAKTSVNRIGADAWSLMHPSVPDKLQSLYNDGYKLVIFTNESNIERWKKKRQVAVDSKIGRLNNFIKQVKVPIQVFVACGLGGSSGQAADAFRKPNLGMWHIMERHFNSGISIDMDQSFYVGDAAGRLNDHSDADVKFAQAIGLKFYAPEEYFVPEEVSVKFLKAYSHRKIDSQ